MNYYIKSIIKYRFYVKNVYFLHVIKMYFLIQTDFHAINALISSSISLGHPLSYFD